MNIDLSIVTVGYRSEDTIIPFLNSIKSSRDKLKKEIIVVDNYGQDNCLALAKEHPLKPTTIQNKENVGFSIAINQGIKKVKGEYILIINPDTRIVGNSLQYLVDFARTKPNLGAVAPKLLNDDGRIQPSIFKFPSIINAFKYYFLGCKDCFGKYFPGNKTVKVEVAVMAAFLVPKITLDIVGGLDERFALYYEDIEYCKRLKKNNLDIYFFPKAKVKHAHGVSGNFKSHLSSPLAKSAQIYHGKFGSFSLNIILSIGQKWQKLLKIIKR